jgi:uncharacterized protein YdhG (YjbR/CyaY superfamily)
MGRRTRLRKDAPDRILTSNSREAAIQEDKGISYGKLTQEQQGLLLSLIQEYASAQPSAVAQARLAGISSGAQAMAARTKAKTIDEYLAALSDAKRAALEELRKTIRAAAPKAEECISYQIPAFRQNRMLVGFGATTKHCAFYLMSSSTVEAHKDALRGYDTSKGTIRFQADKPLPAALVRKLVKARIAENETMDTRVGG